MNEHLHSPQIAASEDSPDVIEQLPVAYFEMNALGKIVRVNQVACRLMQMEREAILGMNPWEFMATDEIEMSRGEFFELLVSDREPAPIRRTFYTRNGEFRTYELYRSRIFDAKGHPAGLRHAAIDITEAQIAQERTRETRMWLESVLESIAEPVLVSDALGMVRYVNPAAERLLRWKAWELIGKGIEKGLPLLSFNSSDGTSLNFRLALDKRCKGVATVLDRDRRPLTVEISTSPIIDREKDFTIGVVSVLRQLKDTPE